MKYQIKFSNHIRVLMFHLIGTALMAVCFYLFRFETEIVKIFGLFLVAYTIPVVYLHFEYYMANRGLSLELNGAEMIITHNATETRYKFDELESVTVFKSAAADKGGIQLLPLDSYHFARIITKLGGEIIITNLLVPDVDSFVRKFNGIKYERKKKLFCNLSSK